jgi:hypothetical protein
MGCFPLAGFARTLIASLRDVLILTNFASRTGRRLILLGSITLATPALAQTCPDLSQFYPGSDPDWPAVDARLLPLLNQCLNSSEYFALRGAAELNTGQLSEALESLERALLLEPDNGAAQIDYALALFEAGQLFAALEINRRLLGRDDLPANLQPGLRQRQQQWQRLTRQTESQLDVLAGYDNNLNGAPTGEQLTLTLSGEPVLLELNPEFQPVSGPFTNLRAGTRFRQLTPNAQHNVTGDVRGRISEDTESDILQFSARYSFIRPDARHAWQIRAGVNHLFFGGSELFTASDIGLVYQPAGDNSCRPEFTVATQHQHFHDQSQLDAIETRVTAGGVCRQRAFGGQGAQRLGFSMGLLANDNVENGRPGGDRQGWQLNFDWQHPLGNGSLRTQLNHTRLRDSKGYSPVLANNAERWQQRSFILFQYREPVQIFGRDTILMVNLYHQQQRSNIELFKNTDTTAEVGFSFRF